MPIRAATATSGARSYVAAPRKTNWPSASQRSNGSTSARAEHAVAHRGEVGHHPVDEFDRGAQVGGERLGAVAVEAVDLDLRPGLDDRVRGSGPADDLDQLAVGVAPDVQHRVHEQVGGDAMPLEHDAHGVDQERGVVGDEQDDRCDPTTSRRGRDSATRPGPASPLAVAIAADVEVGLGDGVQIVVVALVEIEVGQLVVVGGQEAGEQAIVGAASGGDALQTLDRRTLARRRAGRDLPHAEPDLAADRTSDGRY